MAKFRKTESVSDARKVRHRSSFSILLENIQNLRECHEESPRKSTHRLSQQTGISRTSVLRILHDDLKLFRYKIQIFQRQTDQNKEERETFCEDISQRIENDPGLLDLNDFNGGDHCGLCGALATLPVSQNLATKRWIVLLWHTSFLPKSLLHYHCVRRTDFVAKYASMIFIRCCVVNRPFGCILVSKETPRPAVYTTWKVWNKIVKQNFGMKNKIGRFFWATLYTKCLALQTPVAVLKFFFKFFSIWKFQVVKSKWWQ